MQPLETIRQFGSLLINNGGNANEKHHEKSTNNRTRPHLISHPRPHEKIVTGARLLHKFAWLGGGLHTGWDR
jgi:hypothetical protein